MVGWTDGATEPWVRRPPALLLSPSAAVTGALVGVQVPTAPEQVPARLFERTRVVCESFDAGSLG